MLSKSRKYYLSALAEEVAEEYCPNNLVAPRLIADEQSISYSFGNYKDAFDGLIEHDSGTFHIYINLDKAKNEYSPRARFTFAHELGHYFIDEHRNALKSGRTPSHASHNFKSKNPVELEADYFAASLLMPKSRVESDCFKRKFGMEVIEEMRMKYQVSTTATLLRFADIGNHPIMVVCSRSGKVEWAGCSDDFPFKVIKGIKSDRKVPRCSMANEYWQSKREYDEVSEVTAGDWFENVWDQDYDRKFYEKCIYSEKFGYGFILSVLWED